MATSVVDSPPSSDRAPQDAAGNGAGAQTPGSGDPAPEAPQDEAQAAPRCASCGAPRNPGQDWCLQCGAGAPGSIGSRAWRPWVIALAATAVLLLGAAAAAYAALKKEPKHAAVITATVAQAPPPSATVPTTPAPTTPTA